MNNPRRTGAPAGEAAAEPLPGAGSPVKAAPQARRVGLALGSGSARGLAHIGVLRALQQAGLQVEAIAGCSMGALVGAMVASGKAGDLEAAFRAMDWRGILALLDPVFPRSGLLDGKKVERFLAQMLPTEHFDELPVPFRAVATDVLSGDEVTLGSGRLVEAVHASFAVPGLFTPVRRGRRVLVDGGLVNPVPVSTVRAMGARLVVAVDLNHDIVQKRIARNLAPQAAPLAESTPDAAATMPAAVEPPVLERLRVLMQQARHPLAQQVSSWLWSSSPSDAGDHAAASAVAAKAYQPPLPGILETLLASLYITQARLTAINLVYEAPQVLIQPPLGDIRFMEFDRASEIIEIGYRCASETLERVLPTLQANEASEASAAVEAGVTGAPVPPPSIR
ncbi:patatin [Corticibacter populi]|uniref:Patatin n=1 Tax=Corticibacter populi TaxID=1550736 RepID=A0A3M6QIY2_9BURK|nr:patatin-like phospholipase family protein [Corticibacter populi]RMX03013.1 patatin [Corticibacter populi]RZS33445.1 NTE family protein [Corticibacter populi]